MEWPAWAQNSDDQLDAAINQAELEREQAQNEPDDPTARGREEDRTYYRWEHIGDVYYSQDDWDDEWPN